MILLRSVSWGLRVLSDPKKKVLQPFSQALSLSGWNLAQATLHEGCKTGVGLWDGFGLALTLSELVHDK